MAKLMEGTTPPVGTIHSFSIFHRCLSDDEVYEILLKKAGVHVNKGSGFGAEGSGFIRMNIASPRKILEEALDRIEKVFR
jgi:bifunctional pyridoxal-dependent enzyme with beta-cystathionase and maltose regulon repressor activities